MNYITNSPEETEKVGAALGQVLTPGTVIAYKGDLGAGKTAFTRGLARGLGCTELVTSSLQPRPLARPRVKAVFPAPRSPR